MCVGYIVWGLISPRFLAVNDVIERAAIKSVPPLSPEVRHAT
jgi:hypothetical protein